MATAFSFDQTGLPSGCIGCYELELPAGDVYTFRASQETFWVVDRLVLAGWRARWRLRTRAASGRARGQLAAMVDGDPGTATEFFLDFLEFPNVGDITLGGP